MLKYPEKILKPTAHVPKLGHFIVMSIVDATSSFYVY